MFAHHPNLFAIRGLILSICLTLLAACGGVTKNEKAGGNSTSGVTSTTVDAPSAPENLIVTPGNAQTSLTWSASSGATSYDVMRSNTSGGPYTQLASGTSPSYTDSTVSNGTTYYYVVTAANSAGESADSAQVSATPDAAIITPSIPVNLTATTGDAQVTLNWSASSGATNYHVKRATTSGGPYTQVGAPTSPSYTDSSLTNGTPYYYVVSALNSVGESGNSSEVSAIPSAPVSSPAVPAGLSATSGDTLVTLGWSASAGATSYHVKRATTSGGPYSQVGAPTATSYTDSSLTNGTTYYYVVSALDSAGESTNSSEVSAIPSAPVSSPAVPARLSAMSGNAAVALGWSASAGATSYHVKRATTSGGPYAQIGAPNSPSYTDSSLTNGTTYYYVVSALDSAGESANSSQVSALPLAPSPPPTTFGTWTNVTPSGVDLTDTLDCGNYGTESVGVDTANPGTAYTLYMCQGVWKTTDYGQTWTGPINTGTNGVTAGDCAGALTINPNATAGGAATIYISCIRSGTHPSIGFWISTDNGVDWTQHTLTLPDGNQDVYPAVVDPYNRNHLLMPAHEQDNIQQSNDGGHTWSPINLASGMLGNATNTFQIFFVDTGSSTTTAATWICLEQIAGGAYGTWRTTNGGTSWTKVSTVEHNHSTTQIYQPDTSGVLYIAGQYGDSNSTGGLYRSTDYGQTFTHVGVNNYGTGMTAVAGTPSYVYSAAGYAIGPGGNFGPAFQVGTQPGTGGYTLPSTPSGWTQGPAVFGVMNDGTHNVLLAPSYNAGMWRYVEP